MDITQAQETNLALQIVGHCLSESQIFRTLGQVLIHITIECDDIPIAIYARTYVCMYVCMYVCICMHIYIMNHDSGS